MNNDGAPYEPQEDRSHDDGLLLPPWERRDRFGFLNGLYLTVKDVLMTPGRFFQRMPSQVGIMQPLLFAVLLGALGTFIAWLYSLVSSSLQMAIFGDLDGGKSAYLFFLFIFSPLVVVGGIFVQAALTHGMLILLGGGRLGFEATFRVIAYSEAAVLLLIIPLCGSTISLIWSLVILILGLHNIHQTDPWKAVLAVLAPLLVCVSGLVGLIVLVIASVA